MCEIFGKFSNKVTIVYEGERGYFFISLTLKIVHKLISIIKL